MKIAVIEDDKALNLLITKTLSSLYEVKSFYCIEEVNEEFDLYIIDIKLQKHSGLELLKRIKRKSIVITAYASEEIIKEIFNLGASDFIKKPIFKEELLHKIKNLFPSIYKIKEGIITFSVDLKNIKCGMCCNTNLCELKKCKSRIIHQNPIRPIC